MSASSSSWLADLPLRLAKLSPTGVQNAIKDYYDVGPIVAADRARNDQLKDDIAALARKREPIMQEIEAAIEVAKADTARAQAAHQARADPLLEALDRLAIGRLIFQEFKKTLGQHREGVAAAAEHEVRGYGYQSKLCASLSLAYEGFKDSLRRGIGVADELRALEEEMDDCAVPPAAKLALSPLRDCPAARGLEEGTDDALERLARLIGHEVLTAELRATRAKSANPPSSSSASASQKAQSEQQPAPSWWSSLKFSLPSSNKKGAAPSSASSSAAPADHQSHKDDKPDASLAAAGGGAAPMPRRKITKKDTEGLEDLVRSKDYVASLRYAEALVAPDRRSPHEDKAVCEMVGQLAANLGRRVAADCAVAYLDSALAAKRLAFSEPLFDMQQAGPAK